MTLKLGEEKVVFVIDLNHKFLLSTRQEDKIVKKNANIAIVAPCPNQHGVN